MDLRRGIQLGLDTINAELAAMSVPVQGKEAIQNVATISANGDSLIGDILAGIFDRLGQNGTVTVQDGKTLETEVEYVEGIRWDRGFISPYFVTDTKTSKAEFNKPLILLSDKKISSVQSIMKFLEYAQQNKRQLVIVAEDVDGEALATLVLNKLRGGL